MDVQLELLLISTKFFETNLSTQTSPEPRINSCEKNEDQYEKESQKYWSNYQQYYFSQHCRGQVTLF